MPSVLEKAIAELFAAQGAEVHILDLNEGNADEVAGGIKARGGKAFAQVCDVTDQEKVKSLFTRIQNVDILVNSAGINLPKRNFRDVSLAGWDEIVAINLSGTFYPCHAVLPAMRKEKQGLIINIASWFGRYPNELGGPGYNASKRAVIALTETINIEEAANGIRATAILPGEVATPILEKRPVPPPQAERARMLQAEDLGRTVLFVATLPPRACVNELVISPSWNRFILGGLEK